MAKKKEVKEEIIEETKTEVIDPKDEEIKSLKDQIDSLKNQYVKAYADTENLKKRLNQEAENTRKYRIQSFALEVLPVLDNLERALNTEVPEDAKNFYTGVKMIYDQLVNALKNEGVTEIECLNQKFDPNFQQAILTEKKDDVESGVVIEVLQKGYMLKDRILRASMVKVSE